MVKDINPGANSSNPDWLTALSDTTFLFAARTPLGLELWKSDGTTVGTVLVSNIAPGPADSAPRELLRLGNLVYFSAFSQATGRELWRSDGTFVGTTVVDVVPGLGSSMPEKLTAGPLGLLYFTATTPANGRELWVKPGGAPQMIDVFPGAIASDPRSLTVIGTRVYFSARTPGAGGRELWRVTGVFPTQVADLNGTTLGSDPDELAAFNDEIYFTAADTGTGRELFRTDGTAAGTVLVKDINSGGQGSSLRELTESAGTLFFAAGDATNGLELWKTDGTTTGTVLVQNINPRARTGSLPMQLVDVQGTLFFVADDGTHGDELWETDGTSTGTRMVADLVSGGGSSIPLLPVAFGDRMLYFAHESGRGSEPHLAFTDRPPVIDAIGDRTDVEGANIDIPVHASDPDGDPVTLTAEHLPPGITLVSRETEYALVGTLARDSAGTHAPLLRANDGSRTTTLTFSWTVLDITIPTIDNPGFQGNNEGNVISLWVFARDRSGDPVTFSATGLPPGLTIDPIAFPLFGGAAISGTVDPHAGSGSPYTVTVTATDGSHPVSTSFTWTIGDFTTPVVTNPGLQRKNEGNLVSLQILASDAEGDSLAFTAENLPPGLVMFSDGAIFGRLTSRAAGNYDVTVRASDGQNSASTTFTWVVGDLNPPTVLQPTMQNSQAGDTVSLQIVADDADHDPLVYRALNLPPGLAIDQNTGLVSGTIPQDADGPFNVTVSVTDGWTQVQTSFDWNVEATQGGELDPTFDGDGKVVTSFGAYVDRAYATAIQSDGKVVVAGYSTDFIDGQHTGIALARYMPDGSLDPAFGNGGKVVTNLSPLDEARAVLLQGDRILVAGVTLRTTRDFVVLRYTSTGALDPAFGDGFLGRTYIDFGVSDTAAALALQADGKIVVAGTGGTLTNPDFALARLSADGQLDLGFGTSGKVVTDLAGGMDTLTSVAVQPDQSIIAAGHARVANVDQFAAARYLTDGSLDPTFGVDTGNGRTGKAFVEVGQASGATGVTVLSDGRILLGGSSYDTPTGSVFAVLRLTSSGDLDGTFGTNGITTTNLTGFNDEARAMVVQADGKIILAGRVQVNGQSDFALVRYTADGQLDTSFDLDGMVTTDFNGDGDELWGVALDGTRLIAVGQTTNGTAPSDFAVARYQL